MFRYTKFSNKFKLSIFLWNSFCRFSMNLQIGEIVSVYNMRSLHQNIQNFLKILNQIHLFSKSKIFRWCGLSVKHKHCPDKIKICTFLVRIWQKIITLQRGTHSFLNQIEKMLWWSQEQALSVSLCLNSFYLLIQCAWSYTFI